MKSQSKTDNTTPANLMALSISGSISNMLNVAISAAILFLAAKRIDWPFAWIYIIGYLAFRLISLYISLKHVQQSEAQKPPLFDRILDVGYGLTHPVTLILAGFEFSLAQNSQAFNVILQAVASLFLILTFVLMLWAQWENPYYFSNETNFQHEQKIVNTGPYQNIRHPGYAGLFMLAFARPLILGSRLGFLPGIIGASIIILKTIREDYLLQQQNEDYRRYAEVVRYRVFSGIW